MCSERILDSLEGIEYREALHRALSFPWLLDGVLYIPPAFLSNDSYHLSTFCERLSTKAQKQPSGNDEGKGMRKGNGIRLFLSRASEHIGRLSRWGMTACSDKNEFESCVAREHAERMSAVSERAIDMPAGTRHHYLISTKTLLLCAGFFLMSSLALAQSSASETLPSTHFSVEDGLKPEELSLGRYSPAAPGFSWGRPANNPQAPSATMIGEATCVACHTLETEHFTHTLHALGMQVALQSNPEASTCESCHGPGSEHAKDPTISGNIISFTHGSGTPVETQAGACLGCHVGGARDHWLGSVHQRNDLSCSDCHNPMAKLSSEGLLATQSINETCATCHRDIRSQFNRRSHMPLPEGLMACADCHNPHGTLNPVLMKTTTVNETCYECHAEKRGPFLFEHAPVRDSCLNCHTPHGSNQHALLVAPVPFLCQQCHSHVRHPNDLQTPGALADGRFPDERLIARGCLTCHAQIHGSNHPSGPRLHK